MPGLCTPPPAKAPSGTSTNVFAPVPQFATLTETTGRVIDSGARKRARYNGDFDEAFAAACTSSTTAAGDTPLQFSRFADAKSPPPLANDRYELAGGMDRPASFSRHTGDYDDYYQLERQRGMWSTPTIPHSSLSKQSLSANASQATPNGTKPWVLNQIFSIMGGVAGRLVQFCSVPFRGFQAGGGQAYMFNSYGEVKQGQAHDPFVDQIAAPILHAVPGDYPDDNYGVSSLDSLDNERPRLSKRLRTGESWVVVDKDGTTDSRPASPRLSERRVPEYTRSPSQIPRPVSRASITPKRPSLIPVSRRVTTDRKSLHGAAARSRSPTKSYSTSRSYTRQSYGSPVMYQTTCTTNNKTSPLPPDSQRLINKIRHDELEDDARMRRMSSQLSSMLREAREALGSKIEDDGFGDDEGVEDDGYQGDMSWHHR